MFEQCKAEIEELHRFFVAWMTGACAKDEASYDRVRSVLAPDFVIISPNGVTTRCESLLDELYAAHARRANDPGFAIWIEQATQSIGHYDGDTLVVDTVGFNDKTWLDTAGNPHSESLHVIERFRRVNQGTLEVAVVYEDPEVYTKPITGKIIFGLSPNPGGVILEWVDCEDRINELLKSDPCEMGVWELRGVCEERRRGQPAPSTRQTGNPPSAY